VAGALEKSELSDKLMSAGFEQVEIEPPAFYRAEDAREFLSEKGLMWMRWRRKSMDNS